MQHLNIRPLLKCLHPTLRCPQHAFDDGLKTGRPSRTKFIHKTENCWTNVSQVPCRVASSGETHQISAEAFAATLPRRGRQFWRQPCSSSCSSWYVSLFSSDVRA